MRSSNIKIFLTKTALICLIFYASVPGTEWQGRVINAGRDSLPVPDINVMPQMVSRQHPEPVILDTLQSGPDGQFTIGIDNPLTTETYFLSAEYQGVRYYSDALRLSESDIPKIAVFDTTHRTDSVNILMHHVAVQDLGRTAHIRETRVFENTSKRTVLDAVEISAGTALFRFAVPKGLIRFTPDEDVSDSDIVYANGFVYDKRVLPPGKSQLTYMYELQWKAGQTGVLTDIQPGTRSFGVFLADQHLRIISESLRDQGDFSIGGHTYRRYSGQHVNTAKALKFSLQRYSKPQKPWPAVLLTAILCLGAYLYALRRDK